MTTKHEWRKEPPDGNGLWAGLLPSGEIIYVGSEVFIKNRLNYVLVEQWCRISDEPAIAWPVKYREPTIEDWGKECEFSDDEKNWRVEVLRGLRVKGEYRFISDRDGYRFARIVDDGKQAREFWINDAVNGAFAYKSHEDARRYYSGSNTIHVREVLP